MEEHHRRRLWWVTVCVGVGMWVWVLGCGWGVSKESQASISGLISFGVKAGFHPKCEARGIMPVSRGITGGFDVAVNDAGCVVMVGCGVMLAGVAGCEVWFDGLA